MEKIIFWDRKKQEESKEKVYGGKGVRFLYENPLGKKLRFLLRRPLFSRLYGLWQNMALSQRKIAPFIEKFNIDMSEYEKHSFKNFNDFFIRKFKEGKRPFIQEPLKMPAFCEARYYGVEILSKERAFPIKGASLPILGILGEKGEAWRKVFEHGPMLLARLCPVDYHRFHFPDNGRILDSWADGGELESVNPMALREKPEIFLKNHRHISILETENFGKLAFIEVGAICVGKIVQTHGGESFQRGEEKGYFLFGGSTVIMLGEKGRWKPSQDILERTSKGQEVLIPLGDELAHAPE